MSASTPQERDSFASTVVLVVMLLASGCCAAGRSRHVVVSADGATLADSHSPVLLFKTTLPTRFYLQS